MFGRVQFPPKFLAEVFCLTTDALEIIQVLRRYSLDHSAEVRHRHGGEAVVRARMIQVTKEKAHELATLRLALPSLWRLGRFFLEIGKMLADGLHVI